MTKVAKVHKRWIRVLESLPEPRLLQRPIRHQIEGYIEAIEQAYRYQQAIGDSLQVDAEHKIKATFVHNNLDFMILDLIGHFEYDFEKSGQWNKPYIEQDDLERAER